MPADEVPVPTLRPRAWLGPPLDEFPREVAGPVVLVHTRDTAVAVGGIRAYSTGFTFELMIRLRRPLEAGHLFDSMRQRGGDGAVMVGARFAGGRAATLDGDVPADGDPPALLVRAGGSGGTDTEWHGTFWAWPLPPPGPLALVFAWPERAIGETVVEIDGGTVRDAAAEVMSLWA
jgi:hypothetical protein